MVNINKLKGKIVEQGMTIDVFAETAGISRATMFRKLSKEGDDFTIAEADAIVKALKLSKDDANAIFFSQFVA
jgi:predicted transcriptional regulator